MEKSPLKSQKAYCYGFEKETVSPNDYNPVPKLNELIQRSKSFSMMVQMNNGLNLKERNTNISSEIKKFSQNSESSTI